MTTLSPTPSRRRVPMSVIVLVAVLIGALLIGAGLLLTGGDDNDDTASNPAPTPTCSFSSKPPSGTVSINVYNATERAGLAGETADAMEQRDFQVEDVANDPEAASVEGTAVVRYVGKNADRARWVAAQVPDATVTKVSADGRTSAASIDLVIGDGFEELATPAAAKTAYAQLTAAAECGSPSPTAS